MNTEKVVEELEGAARKLGYEVRVEKGNFRGGRCTLGGEAVIMLNRRHIPDVRLAVLAESLRGTAIDTVYLTPAVRRALEDAWAAADAAATTGNTTDDDEAAPAPSQADRSHAD
jgi:hypothetical protein